MNGRACLAREYMWLPMVIAARFYNSRLNQSSCLDHKCKKKTIHMYLLSHQTCTDDADRFIFFFFSKIHRVYSAVIGLECLSWQFIVRAQHSKWNVIIISSACCWNNCLWHLSLFEIVQMNFYPVIKRVPNMLITKISRKPSQFL